MQSCTLDLYTDYLLSSTGPTTAPGLSRLLEGALSHDHITRWLRSTPLGSAQVWRQAKALIRQAEARRAAEEFAVLIVDDSVLEKAHTDANELTCTHWDHRQQRYVKGFNFVTLLYQAGELALPIAVELVRKTGTVLRTKTHQTSLQTKTVARASCIWSAAIPTWTRPALLRFTKNGGKWKNTISRSNRMPRWALATQATHFLTAVLAYTKLEGLKLKCGIGHFRLKAQLYTVGLKAMYQQLRQLSA